MNGRVKYDILIRFSNYLQHVNNYMIQNIILIAHAVMTVFRNNLLVSGISFS